MTKESEFGNGLAHSPPTNESQKRNAGKQLSDHAACELVESQLAAAEVRSNEQ